jgi:hypothetical protein
MPEALRNLFRTEIAGIPIGKGVAYDVGISSASALMSLIEALWPALPSSLVGLLVAWLAKMNAVRGFIGEDLSELISVGGVYVTSRQLLQLEMMIKGLLGGVAGQTLGQLTPAATAITPVTTVAPVGPALSSLERQLSAIRA